MLNESQIIQMIKNSSPYIGDDAAVLPSINSEQQYLITKDLLIEDIHFRRRYYSPEDLAHKTVHVNLSDLAAMGAQPTFLLGGIAIPLSEGHYAKELISHLIIACQKENVILIGGDTTRSADKLHISITALGTASPNMIKYRHTAQPTNKICVAGHLGYAHLGFKSLEINSFCPPVYQQTCLRPYAKIKEGLWLAQHTSVTSMLDLSDGLFVDLERVCQASHVAGIIELESLPISPMFLETCKKLSLDPIQVKLTGGEDYSLLFTVQANAFRSLANDFYMEFGYAIQCIGHLRDGLGVSCTHKNKYIDLNLQPFNHFGEN